MVHEFLKDEEVPTVEQLLEECMPLQAKTDEAILSGIEMQAVEELPAALIAAKQEPEGSRKAKKKRPRVSSSKKTIDRHVKVEGKGRRVRLAECMCRSASSQTICWLLENAEHEIIKATNGREKKN